MNPGQATRNRHTVRPRAHRRSLLSAPVLLFFIGGILPGCSPAPPVGGRPRPEPAELWVEPARLDLRAGEEGAIQIQVNDRSGQPIGGAPVRLYAQDSQLLHVNALGIVRALGPVTAGTYVIAQSGPIERRIPVTVAPGPLERLVKLDPDPASAVAGQPLVAPLRVRATDAWNNPIGGIHLTVADAAASDHPNEVVTDAAGVAVAALDAPSRSGPTTLLVRPIERDAPRVTYTLSAAPAAPAELRAVLRAADVTAPADGVAPLVLEISVCDRFRNPVPALDVRVRVGSAGSARLAAQSDATGVAHLPVTWRKRTGPLRIRVDLPAFPGLGREFALPAPAAPTAQEVK